MTTLPKHVGMILATVLAYICGFVVGAIIDFCLTFSLDGLSCTLIVSLQPRKGA